MHYCKSTWILIGSIALMGLLGGIGAWQWRTANQQPLEPTADATLEQQIKFHSNALSAARAAFHQLDQKAGDSDSVQDLLQESLDQTRFRYEHHRNRLVELGQLVAKQYTFNTRLSAAEAVVLQNHLNMAFPRHDADLSSALQVAEPTMLMVYDRPANIPAWDAFVAAHDVPDFAERHMRSAQRSPATTR